MILAAVLAGSLQTPGVMSGVRGERFRPLEPFRSANVLVFIATDCPVANGYAPEIQRVCAAYASKGVDCLLVYEDPGIGLEAVHKHLSEFQYGAMPAAIDRDGSLAVRVGAAVTPEVAVVDRSGAVRYRGRIDDKYIAIGRQRRSVTTHELTDALDAVLAGRPVTAKDTQAVGCVIVSPDMRRKQP
jgi:hypothetical protein